MNNNQTSKSSSSAEARSESDSLPTSSSDEDPLTQSFSRLVNRARLLARSPQPSASPRGSTLKASSRQELDEILDRFEKWSSSSVTAKPSEEPDRFAPVKGGAESSESAAAGSVELPSKNLLERLVDVVDRVTGGAEETFAAEPKVTSLFSRSDKSHTSAPLTPEARQSTQRLQESLRKVSSIRSGSKAALHDDPNVTQGSEVDPKIEVHRPASMESSASETTGSFLSRLLWGRKESHEEKIESEVNEWIKTKMEQESESPISPTQTSLPDTSKSTRKDSKRLSVESKKPRSNRVGRTTTLLNVLDNTVAQIRLKDDEEKERVRRQREMYAAARLSPSSKSRTKHGSTSTNLTPTKPVRIKKIIFSKSHLFKLIQSRGTLSGYEDAVEKISSRLDQQFLANFEAVRKAQPQPQYM